jgi:tRNA modification GTPase
VDLVDDAGGDELVAVEVRIALDEIGKITGTIYTDDILDVVFGKFCVGK